MKQQLQLLHADLSALVGRRRYRWLTVWFRQSAGVVISYRLDRGLALFFGSRYGYVRNLFVPLFAWLAFWSTAHDIHYLADIGPGLHVMHPALGIVISAHTTAGERLAVVGGNSIGLRKQGKVVLGSGVTIGANAVILGPLTLGDNVTVGALSLVLHDAPDGATLVGNPARILDRDTARDAA